ncbi:MAG: alpha/beta fold hydrolase [Actinobacteria bacterium]|nr:MAG: alpha/beta fold hydrolase [Actinomycetota bacterium]
MTMARLSPDDLFDGQAKRVLGLAPAGAADVGEVMTAAALIKGSELDSWYDEWVALADRVLALADDQAAAGRTVSARAAYLRGANYLRAAGSMLMGAPLDPRLKSSHERHCAAFAKAAALSEHPLAKVTIPYEDTELPGYFGAPSDDGAPRPTLILLGGYDSTLAEGYSFNGSAAIARGYNILTFDGPGQGSALIDDGLTLRPDWGAVITPVVDFLSTRPDVDPARIGLVGLSLGAHLGPRAAADEHRLAALVADCGAFDLYAPFLQRLPGPLRAGYTKGERLAVDTVREMLDHMAAQPTAGWSLRRGMQVHGVATPMDYIEATREYTLAGHAERISCPTFVCNAEDDPISATAPTLVAALTCPKEFVTFTVAEGAGEHCESMARDLYHARSFGWLDAVLRPGVPG